MGLGHRPRPADVVVLLYHRVGTSTREIDVPVSEFRQQMHDLALSGRAITLDDALRGRGGVVVTFDDGSDDLISVAVPILADHGLQATAYLTTADVKHPSQGPFNWQELRGAAEAGVLTLGSHTHNHVDLSVARDVVGELEASKSLIEDNIGHACRHFAYPWARSSPAARELVSQHFASAATKAWATNRGGIKDPHDVGRIPILRSDTRPFFELKIAGRLDAEGLAYRLAGRGPWRPS